MNGVDLESGKNNVWVFLLSSILAFFEPIAGNIFALAWIFVLNFVAGLLAGIVAQGEGFDFRKASVCVGEACIFFLFAASVYVCGKENGNERGAIQCVSLFVYIALWFYTTNILKNLRRILPEGSVSWSVIDFIYNVISLEFARRIPGLTKYVKENGKHKKG